jgi:hypothetical protein
MNNEEKNEFCYNFLEQWRTGGYGYHVHEISKGVLGEVSKIEEEFLEFKDALSQGVSIMALIELSDMVGAIESFLENKYPNITIQDLVKMSDVTKRAFKNGNRL